MALSAIQAVDMPWAANVFDIGSVQQQDLYDLVKNKFGDQAANSDKATALVQRLSAAIENHRKQFGDRIVAGSDEQEKFTKILADMQVK